MIDLTKNNRFELVLFSIILIGAAIWAYFNTPKDISPDTVQIGEQKTIMVKKEGLQFSSPAFIDNETIPTEFTCDGQSVSPQLLIDKVPEKTKTLALIMEDPDAPRGTFVHWVMWNISPQTTEIPQGGVPEKAVVGTNGAGKVGYVGPCPPASAKDGPSGIHRYFFKLYALEIEVGLDSKGTVKDVEAMMSGHILDQATLVGRYGR